jgi:outer membrane lipoprotein-sorting protein
MLYLYSFILFLSSFMGFPTQNPVAPKDYLTKMITAMDNVKTAKYNLHKVERVGKKTVESEIIVKLSTNPSCVYIYSVSPNPGAEVLWVKGQNNDKVKVSPNKFPFITLDMNTSNTLLRQDQHHTTPDIGFAFLSNVLKDYISKIGENFYKNVSYEGLIDWKGKQYYKIVIDNVGYGYTIYSIKRGESITNIAAKLGVSDYMIMTLNPNLADYNDARPGQKIKVPTAYAKKIVLYLDKLNYLPMGQYIYDDKGLFEQYELSSFILNPVISPAEFTPKYPGYKF